MTDPDRDRVEFFGTPPGELADILGGSGRAQIPWRLVRAGQDPFAPGSLVEGARQRLIARCLGRPLAITERRTADCGTTKLLLALRDGARVETVIIPSERRTTVCVSSQVGCARGCSFCLTASLGLIRSLNPAEIVGQIGLAIEEVSERGLAPLRNVVFMGMGEPLDNLAAVRRALAVITAPHGLAIGPGRITLSTVGTSPRQIHQARDLGVHLAWSLHSANPTLRRRLVPTDRHDLTALRDAFVEVLGATGGVLFVEIALIRDLNDATHDAEALVEFLAPLRPNVRVNLLPMNRARPGLEPASTERTEAFGAVLHGAGYRCIIRRPRGAEMGAACGQLACEPCPSPNRE